MTDISVLRRLQDIWDQVATLLSQAVASDAGGRPWTLAYLDVRSGSDGDGRLQKWRVELVSGERLTLLDVPSGVSALMLDAYDLRDAKFSESEKWYGVLMTVYPNGQCEVKLDYDRECIKKGFFNA